MSIGASIEVEGRPSGLRGEWVVINGEKLLMLSHPLAAPPPRTLNGLTAAQHAIVAHVVAGRSNTESAAARGTSPRTVAKQLERIYARVGVGSRAELCVRMLSAGPASER